ncbi:hypothetical protein B0H10DRAFT_978895 [Mycena sp. CBHHK59/15]|nr:hypothetical protein B0H10DRAFT_978895 [Mycena sp. CBHHK59/15]
MATIPQLTIPMFLGTILNWGLFGALFVQVYIYFLAFPTDRAINRILVVVVFVAEFVQTATDTRNTIRVFGAGWGHADVLDDVGWAWFSVPVMGSIVACIGQTVFAWRIYILGRKLYIPALVTIIAAVQLVAGIWAGVQICLVKKFSLVQSKDSIPISVWLAATSLCDLMIVLGTTFHLIRSRDSEYRRTNAIISRIIKVTVETGVLCALFAFVDLGLFLGYKDTNYHLSICIWLSKAYSNSIVLLLNSRARIEHRPLEDVGITHDLVFRSGIEPASIQISHSFGDSESIHRIHVGKNKAAVTV